MTTTTETGSFWDRAAETMPREQLERMLSERVRSCLQRMQASEVRYYRERLLGIESAQIRSVEDLSRLPFTTKDDLREHYPFGLFLVPRGDIVRIHASSGSTGKPTVVAYTRSDIELWSGLMARSLVAGGMSEDDVFQNALGYGLFTGDSVSTRRRAGSGPPSSPRRWGTQCAR
jgi:phenylacetate-CoA ligase